MLMLGWRRYARSSSVVSSSCRSMAAYTGSRSTSLLSEAASGAELPDLAKALPSRGVGDHVAEQADEHHVRLLADAINGGQSGVRAAVDTAPAYRRTQQPSVFLRRGQHGRVACQVRERRSDRVRPPVGDAAD